MGKTSVVQNQLRQIVAQLAVGLPACRGLWHRSHRGLIRSFDGQNANSI